MDNIQFEATNSSPSIVTHFEIGQVEIRGKSYPEDTYDFFLPLVNWLKSYLESNKEALSVIFEIQYFNSTSSQVFYTIFEILEKALHKGKIIKIDWEFDPENSSVEEEGEDFQEEFETLTINMVPKKGDIL